MAGFDTKVQIVFLGFFLEEMFFPGILLYELRKIGIYI